MKIIAETGNWKQLRQVVSGLSLLSQSSIWPTFGLGDAATVRTLTIHWPSGIVQTLQNVKTGQILRIQEGAQTVE